MNTPQLKKFSQRQTIASTSLRQRLLLQFMLVCCYPFSCRAAFVAVERNRTAASVVRRHMMFHSSHGTTTLESPHLQFIHRTEPVSSTQDEMRSILLDDIYNNNHKEFVAIVATTQTAGRGTHGRTWQSATGNLFLTVALPLSQIPVPITLLPLHVGVLVAQRVDAIITAACGTKNTRPTVTLKWPNDVLMNNAKVAGCLIESYTTVNNQQTWLLVGIGVNVGQTPQLDDSREQQKRVPTCIQDWCQSEQDDQQSSSSMALALGLDIANALADWVTIEKKNSDGQDIVTEWRQWAEFGKQYELRETGEMVTTVDIEADGRLRVRDEKQQERLLVADYLV